MPTRTIIGLMSGTSVDGIDAAVVRFRGGLTRKMGPLSFELVGLSALRWPRKLRARLLAVMAPADATTQEICTLNALVSHEFARAALHAARAAGLGAGDIAAIACHGQTICHLPPAPTRSSSPPPRKPGSTLQLGDPSIIATLTGITTVGNFRPADMTLGGQGAPLVPFADAVLLTHATNTRCVQNIGGIANVTYLPPHSPNASVPLGFSAIPSILAFDTGPGNMLMDALVSLSTDGRLTYDRGGRMAAAGTLDAGLFAQLRGHPYFSRRPPKSTGREEFGMCLARSILGRNLPARGRQRESHIADLATTATHLTAWSIVDAYLSYLPTLPDEVILCGGGADNPFLVSLIQRYLNAAQPPHSIALGRIDEVRCGKSGAIPNKAKEALSFALLGLATLDHVPSSVPSVTGASRPAVLGVIARP